jgi:hypothetical protein
MPGVVKAGAEVEEITRESAALGGACEVEDSQGGVGQRV